MTEEVPFKSLKITLSEEALEKLNDLRIGGSFRSDSATIEECIRVTRDIFEDVLTQIRIHKIPGKEELTPVSESEHTELLRRIITRIGRFGKAMKLP